MSFVARAITANKFKALLEWKDRLGETPETKMTL